MKRKIYSTMIVLLIAGLSIAQESNVDRKVNQRLDKLNEVVALSDDQRQELEPILKAGAEEIRVLRQSGEADKSKIKEIRQSQNEAVKSVLTDEQKLKLDEAAEVKKEERKAAKKDIREHNKENVKPLLVEHRKDFESKLSNDEKAIIEDARNLRKEHKSKGKDLSPEEREAMKANRNEIKVLLSPIVANHSAELERIRTEMEPTLANAKEHAKKAKGEEGSKPHRKNTKNDPDRFNHRFLLMKAD